ncbi:MAG: carboxy terminal-processing peptidase [Bacteroidales bacterium]|jgi:carboxyl-terminal processing protease|nr:carboxy terminal-processing peptidase [Bacteroidales bacterium]
MKSSEKSSSPKAKVRLFIPATFIILVSTSLLYSFCKQRPGKNDVILQMVIQLAERDHFSPPKINDQFSEKVFSAYLKKLDPYKWFLTREDVQQMEAYKLQIDDQIHNNTYQLYELAGRLMDKRIPEVQEYYREILSQPFDFTTSETWEADQDKRDWPANSAELKENWRKELKWRILTKLANGLEAQEKETDQSKIKSPDTLEFQARKRELKSLNDIFLNNLPQQKSEGKFSLYINAIMAVSDPHTMYNTPFAKEDFDMRMSGQFEGIGAKLQASDGYAKVVMLIPGSPSWIQGEMKVNDLITRVKQENEAESVDIFGMGLDDAVKLIRGKKGTRVTLTVKRGDGSTHEITITRDVVIDEETYAKSAVLTDSVTGIKAGYIDLPSFYVDFKKSATGRASSDDIAKEIEKLKKEGVQGIILDLRSNLGGSLPDAIKIGGLFINTGPVVQVKSNIGMPRVYSDEDPSVQYDGPFVILVSSISASASEIVAAAMQDYQRAVIIGAPQTFGKGTVQIVAELDAYLPNEMNSLRPMGSLLLTIQKFYRINGGSTQMKGVASDIVLPDVYSEMKIGERFEDNCLPWTTVSPAKYQVWEKPVPVTALQKKSRARTAKSENFKLLNEQMTLVKQQRDKTRLTLNLKTYQQEEEKRKSENKRFEEFSKQSTVLTIAAPRADIAEMEGDTAKITRSVKWLKDLNKDIYLEEAVKVIGDMK